MTPKSISSFLKHVSKAIERLTDDEVADVVAGRRRLILTTEEASPNTSAATHPNFDTLISSLKAADTRDAAHRVIEDAALTRSQLAQLAKTLDLPVQRSDDVARLREKIVENTIGFRLTSSAIQKNG